MKKNLTELVFILDKSGSMAGLESDTIGGFNSMLKKQKVAEGECFVTTVLFNHQYELIHDRIDLRAIKPISGKEYSVGGCTALVDAIGETVNKIITVQKNTAPEYRAKKVLFVIITDGYENASSKYSSEEVKQMIETQKKRYNWEFIFLGANIDAVETAKQFGISAKYSANYVPDKKGTKLNYEAMAEGICCFVCEESRPIYDSLDAIRKDMKERGKRK